MIDKFIENQNTVLKIYTNAIAYIRRCQYGTVSDELNDMCHYEYCVVEGPIESIKDDYSITKYSNLLYLESEAWKDVVSKIHKTMLLILEQ